MKNRKALSIVTVTLILFCFATQAAAMNYGASVSVQYGANSQYVPGQSSASYTIGGAAASAGFYAASPVLSATADGSSNYAFAAASIGDWLQFSGPTGSSAQVNIHVAGNWGVEKVDATVSGGPYVRFSLGFTPQNVSTAATFDSRRAIYYLSVQDISSGLAGTGGWTELSYVDTMSASGTYSYDITANVTYGVWYHMTMGVWTENVNTGLKAFIDDPITITVPNGVTYESLSGTKYSASSPTNEVPEPATMLLLGFGVAGLAGARRFRK